MGESVLAGWLERPLSHVLPPTPSHLCGPMGALANQQWSEPWEVLVVNNRCTDRSIEIVERYRERLPRLRVVDASARQGQAHALNVGARAATSDALAFCDADDVVGQGCVVSTPSSKRAVCKYSMDSRQLPK